MNKRVKKFCSLLMLVCLSCSIFYNDNVQAATNVYVQTADAGSDSLKHASTVYEVTTFNQENMDSIQDFGNMIYVNHDKIETNEEIKETSLYQSETTKYFSDGQSDFFDDCSSDYWFSRLENYTAARDYQTLYLNILNLLKSNYESAEDVSAMDFDGTSYYCIGNLDYATLGISNDKLSLIFNYVLYDHPLLFNCDRTIIYDGINIYLIAEEEFVSGTTRQTYRTNIENAIKAFEASTKDAATNFEIVQIVHDEVVQTLEYGYEEDGVTPLDNGYVHSPAGYVHTDKLAVCDGYTCMIQAVLSYLDIENYFVPGTAADSTNGEKHAWNLVALGNGNYYFVDATWYDTAAEDAEEDYFCFGYNTYATTHDTSAIVVSNFNIPKSDYFTMEYGEWVANTPDTGIVKIDDPVYIVINTCEYEYEDGVLTFSGKGKILNTGSDGPGSNPWQQYKDSVTKIVFGDGITGIDVGMFKEYKVLQTIDFGNTVVSIGDNAFAGCEALEEVALPDNMTYYGGGMFDGCTNLTSISFGSTPENGAVIYASGMFVRTPNLKRITVSGDNNIFEAENNVLYDKNRKVLLAYPGGCTDASFTVKDGTEKIMRFAFCENDDLEEIHFPESLKVVDTCSFYVMDKLDNVCFPASVEYFYDVNIESEKTDGNFHFCPSLKKITNLSEATCYITSGSMKDDTSISGTRTGYWYSETQRKYVTEIGKEVVVLRDIRKPVVVDSTFEVEGVTYQVTSWKEGLSEVADTIGWSGIDYITPAIDMINMLEETAGYVTVVSDSENGTESMEIPDTVNYKYWNYIVNKQSVSEDNVQHQHQLEKTEKVEADCTVSGNCAYWSCSLCGKKFLDEDGACEVKDDSTLIIEAKGHAWNDYYTVDKEATATEAGSKSIHCKDCGAIKEGSLVVIPATGSGQDEPGQDEPGQDEPGQDEPGQDEPGKDEPGKNDPATPQPPKKGDQITDAKSKAIYLVTKAGTKTGNVTYIKPTNSKAKKVTVPASIKKDGVTYKVTAIADSAFKNHKKMTSVVIEKNVTKIGKNVFKGCNKLKQITIKSKKLTSKTVSKNAFKGISAKATVKVPKGKLKSYKKLLHSKGLSKKIKIK